MFQTLAIYSPTSSIPSSSLHFPRRLSSIRCRAATATAESLSRCQAQSLYEVLKVKNNASMADIKVAYRRLAKIYHPDAAECLSDGFDFIQIHKAYETLSDPKNRSDYDREIGRMMMSRSVYSSANSNSAAVVRRPGFYQTRRWESDQCW